MNKLSILLALVVASPLVACKKDSKEPGAAASGAGAAKASEGGAADKPVASGPFGAWDMDARKAAFQGAFVTPGDSVGLWQAWNVEGNKITKWDGVKETVADLALLSPCEAYISVTSNGSTSGTVSHYTIEGGKLVIGLGDAGARNGATAVACISDQVVTLDAAGTCLQWEQDPFEKTKYTSGPGKCGFAKEGDKEVFKATVAGIDTTLEVHGDALYAAQMSSTHAEKVTDYAAAKAGRDAKK